jgi:hypothetical protein
MGTNDEEPRIRRQKNQGQKNDGAQEYPIHRFRRFAQVSDGGHRQPFCENL